MMPAITRYFHEMAGMIVWFAGLILVSAIVAAVAARIWGRTKQSRQVIYSVVGLIGVLIGGMITIGRLRGIRFTPWLVPGSSTAQPRVELPYARPH
jgi:hypothetical protein